MSEVVSKWERRLRAWLMPLQSTPLHPQWLAHRIRRDRARWLARRASGDVLDVGCSDQSVREGLPGIASYLGLDYPKTAQTLYGTRPQVYADASSLPFAGEAFDCVLLLDVLEHLSAPEQALGEARRVLRRGGQLLLTIPFAYPLHDLPHDYQRFTRAGLEARLARAGFVVAELEEAGDGVESAALGFSLAVVRGVLSRAGRWPFAFVLLAPVLALMPIVNCLGWLLSRLAPAPGFLPGAYFVRAVSEQSEHAG